ncbi:hypothetical protein Ocin01_13432 [Orchesella cincta]|uniref:CUB domain-containing protein n=1 Tax=Orchesella cincta TaxID=48709 RepID=A0A1D2MJR4_ORCCI|nr:hypothetical protein Ocin01_13432 [Orchesella cincta]
MKISSSRILVVLSFIVASSCAQETLTECGQVIFADSGTIEYKLDTNYDMWEACAFIVRVQNFSYIKFTLEESGINGRDRNAINILGFNEQNLTETYQLGPPNTELVREVKGNIAVVIFKSMISAGTGTGFRLTFQGIRTAKQSPPGFDLVFNNEKSSPLQVPFSDNFTDVASTNLMVFTAGAHMLDEFGIAFKLGLSGHMMEEPYCWDYFVVYSFAFEGEVVLEQTFCELETAEKEFLTGGIFIVFFRNYGGRFTKAIMDWGTITDYYDDA